MMKTISVKHPAVVLCGAVLLGIAALAFAASPTDKELKGAKIASALDAKKAALLYYAERITILEGGLSSQEGPRGPEVVRLGYNLPGFAHKGDVLWELRIVRSLPLPEELRAILWVNAKTGKVHPVAGPWDSEGAKKAAPQ